MINKSSVLVLVDGAIRTEDGYIEKYDLAPDELEKHVKHVLSLLKIELLSNNENINVRVLRAFKDVTSTIAIHYEETPINDSIFEIYRALEMQIPEFARLELLRMDFGKGNPI